jgi:hypothetical protein
VAEIELTKGAVAHRLLKAAIRSWFREDDPLATYLLASACHGLLYDLTRKTGVDPIKDRLARGIWQKAVEVGSGAEPPEEDNLRAIVETLASEISSGRISDYKQVNLIMNDTQTWEILRSQREIYNFIKHADRDHRDSISESRLDCREELMSAASYHLELFGSNADEIDLFVYMVQREIGEGYAELIEGIAETFDKIPDSELKQACMSFLSYCDSAEATEPID